VKIGANEATVMVTA